jgi:hypothetical protein
MARQPDEGVARPRLVASDRHRADRGEQGGVVPLADQHLLQLRQQLRLVHPGQHQRPPRHTQQRAQRRLVGTVAADVADDGVHRARRAEHGVEEVAADE